MKREVGVTAGACEGEFVQYIAGRGYSLYEEVIAKLRRQLKYVNRNLKKKQRAFHDAEGRLHAALMKKGIRGDAGSDTGLERLQKEADYCMERFCEVFKLQQELVGDLQDAIHADATGKEMLHNFSSVTQH